MLGGITSEEWAFLNSLDFDSLFEVSLKPRSLNFEHVIILRDIISGRCYESILGLKLLTYIEPWEAGRRAGRLTDKGCSLIKWSILNRFSDVCLVIDNLLSGNITNSEIFIYALSLIPIDNYGIMLSRSNDPSKLLKFMGTF